MRIGAEQMIEKTCPVCGESFTLPPTRKNQIYCSRNCAVVSRQITKEDNASHRIDAFIESLPDLNIIDVVEGKVYPGNTNNQVIAKGVGAWPEKRFKVIIYDDD